MPLPGSDAGWPPAVADGPLAVLVSGGLDSAVLLAEAVRVYPAVHPIFVRVGSVWEAAEFFHLTRFLAAIASPTLCPCVELVQPVGDLYGRHWSLTGHGTPGKESPDEDVYLPGRNVLLLAKPLLWCHLNGVPELATAPLTGNPFPDATADFYTGFARLVSQAVTGRVRVLRPYAALQLSKADVLRRGRGMPLAHTFSCIRPVGTRHCGTCNKCGERQAGFAAASVPDPTDYVD
ncbi:7-cyano-7-deazaguanine synthase [Limnoglobus roseus]|uniref:7-cyano-7-deazaguanine synthase n=1 Tax=Limnoglobus roseus TaxID=2598579 RepID=A0A5C1AD93_9BACT|nr:7-cyano-7-deazaguanine synthase [Limnoglobus roseus]QEL16183.1 7-cyano-7-deazaguanine synthase [Limnoglobus roseus]